MYSSGSERRFFQTLTMIYLFKGQGRNLKLLETSMGRPSWVKHMIFYYWIRFPEVWKPNFTKIQS